MRLLVYNIRYGTGTGADYHWPLPFAGAFRRCGSDFKAIGSLIRSVSPDLTVLLETDEGSYRTGGRSQAEELARSIDARAFFAGKYGSRPWINEAPLLRHQGNAVLSRLPVETMNVIDLGKGVKRTALALQFQKLSLFAVHLSLGRRTRQRQLELLAQEVTSCSRPVIVAGDFNTFYGSGELANFMDITGLAQAESQQQNTNTWPARRPVQKLDWILHSPQICSQALTAIPVTWSDHRPLVWDFEVQWHHSQSHHDGKGEGPSWNS